MQEQGTEMLRKVMDLSLKELQADLEKQKQQEVAMKVMMEKTKIEAEHKAMLDKKDAELRALQDQLADAKKRQEQQLEAKKGQELQAQQLNIQ